MSGSDDWNRHVEQSRQRDLEYFKIHGRLESDPLPTGSASAPSGGPGGLLALTAVAGVAASMLVMARWIADQGTALEDGLRRLMPESWFSSPDGDGRLLYVGLAVGIPVAAALLVLFVLSMRLSVVSLAATFVVGIAFMVTLIVGGVVILQAISLAAGHGIDPPLGPGWGGSLPWIITAVTAVVGAGALTLMAWRA